MYRTRLSFISWHLLYNMNESFSMLEQSLKFIPLYSCSVLKCIHRWGETESTTPSEKASFVGFGNWLGETKKLNDLRWQAGNIHYPNISYLIHSVLHILVINSAYNSEGATFRSLNLFVSSLPLLLSLTKFKHLYSRLLSFILLLFLLIFFLFHIL